VRILDGLQWLFLALVAAGFFMISVRAGLICAGILGIIGTTVMELTARRKD
jgi:hypothetical protein